MKVKKQYKKQHYVPQSILERFAFDGELLYVYDKFKREVRQDNKRDVAHENYFYDVPDDLVTEEFIAAGSDPQAVERFLGSVDAMFHRDIEELLNWPKHKTIPDELRMNLCYGLAFQIIRTKSYRNMIVQAFKQIHQAVGSEFYKKQFPTHDPNHLPEFWLQKKHDALVHIQHMFDEELIDRFVSILFGQIWTVGVNNTGTLLYTSDAPVLKHHHIDQADFKGWNAPGVEICFPLSPRRILILRERNHFQKKFEKFDGKQQPIYVDEVQRYNSLQVFHSHRQIYSQDGNFKLVDDICQQHPKICSPESEKVKITVGDKLKIDLYQ